MKKNKHIKSIERRNRFLEAKIKESQELSLIDELTGLYNRRAYNEHIVSAVSRYQRLPEDQFLALFVADLDYFKKINDSYGHQVGDKVLEIVSSCIKKVGRNTDKFYRLGGDEIGGIIGGTIKSGIVISSKIRESLENISYELIPTEVKRPTMSFGITFYSSGIKRFQGLSPSEVAEQMYCESDEALYHSKAAGKNTTTVYQTMQREREIMKANMSKNGDPTLRPVEDLSYLTNKNE